MAMGEPDEIAQLEAASQKLMTEPAPTLRKRESAGARSNTDVSGQQSKSDVASVESLLAEIRDLLNRLLQESEQTRGKVPENPSTTVEEADELRKAFPHEEAGLVAAKSESAVTIPPPLNPVQLLATVEDRVTQHALAHHSSVVVLLGWAMALLSAGLGMGYGYIVAIDRYPFWWTTAQAGVLSRIAAAYLGAPVGVVLLPLAGAILWGAGKEASSEKQQVAMRLAAIGVFLAGILLPVTAVL